MKQDSIILHFDILILHFLLFRFRSPLLTESLSDLRRNWFIFHVLLRCFTSHGSRVVYPTIYKHALFQCIGFPIRISPDQSSVASSPKLFVGSNVLHRLILPRHSPYTLICFNPDVRSGLRLSSELNVSPFSRGLVLTSNLCTPSASWRMLFKLHIISSKL